MTKHSSAGLNAMVPANIRRIAVDSAIPANPIASKSNTIVPGPEKGSVGKTSVPIAEGAWTVKVAATLPAAGFRFRGVKLQLPPAGSPAQASPTASLKPFLGITVIVNVPEDPGATARVDALMDIE
jgi:hypothetical protein